MTINNTHKGICLIAFGIIMRDTACSAEEVQTLHNSRYVKLIEKKGKTANITTEEAEVLSKLSVSELTS